MRKKAIGQERIMWFKQVQLFKFENKFPFDAQELEGQLEQLTFTPCLPSFSVSQGWAPPTNEDEEDAKLVFAIPGFLLICLQVEEKILPSAVVHQQLKKQIKEIESTQNRKVSYKERNLLKQRIYQELLPQAFGKITRNYAIIDIKNKWLILSTNNPKRTENFISFFKRSLNEIKMAPPELKKISPILTDWLLNGKYPESLNIEDACTLQDPKQVKRSVKIERQDLSVNYVQILLKSNFEVSQLKITWSDQITFTLKNDFTLQSLQYQDSEIELQNENESDADEGENFQADFFIMTGALTKIFQDLLRIFERSPDKNP